MTPRVLIIGDSISMGYTEPVTALLAGRAEVERIPINGGPTIRAIAHLDEWLGDGGWDIILFNFGLHDLKIMETGIHQVPPEEYEANLREITARLKATGAKLIWVTTTPVVEGTEPPRNPEDARRYNEIAQKIMDENSVATLDLYALCLPRLAEVQIPVNVHFTESGYDVLAEWVAEAIAAQL